MPLEFPSLIVLTFIMHTVVCCRNIELLFYSYHYVVICYYQQHVETSSIFGCLTFTSETLVVSSCFTKDIFVFQNRSAVLQLENGNSSVSEFIIDIVTECHLSFHH